MAIPRYRSKDAWPPLSAGFRPFFLAAGLWACLSMGAWILMLRGLLALPTRFVPVTWHFHEMLFGFVAAAITGFVLTAIPNWTGRLPLQGRPLGALVLLWLAGRAATACSAWIGPILAAAVDVAFLVVLAAVAGREVVAGRNWRNLPVVFALALLIAANAMIHVGSFGPARLEEAGKRLALAVVVMLITLIGGRIVPSFTANWLRRRGAHSLPIPFNWYDRTTLAASIAGLAAWAGLGPTPVSGAALLAAGALQAIRLTRWRGSATREEPLLWILHVGYAWVPAGLALLGVAAWRPELGTTAIHALTAGAMGTMILAVMTRASLGHTKRALTAGKGTLAIYVLVLLAALARVAAPQLGIGYSAAIEIAGGAWIAAFALFVALYAPLYVRP